MAYTLANLTGVVRAKFYPELKSVLNDEAIVAEICEENPYPWQGSQISVTFQNAFDLSGGYIAESGAINPPGNAGFQQVNITTTEYAHRFQISLRTLNAAEKEDKDGPVLANALRLAKDKVKQGAKQRFDVTFMFGGRVKAFLNEQKAQSSLGDFAGVVANANPTTWEAWSFLQPTPAGNTPLNPFQNVVAAAPATWIRVQFFRTDTYAEVVPTGAAAANTGFFVSDFSAANGTITISIVSDGGVGTLTSVPIAAGFGMVLVLSATNAAIGTEGVIGQIAQTGFANEPIGLLGNLGDPLFFGVDRSTATGGANSAFQSSLLTMSVVEPQARAALNATRIQAVMDRVMQLSGGEIDRCIMSPLTRSIYTAALTATTQFKHNDGAAGSEADLSPGKQLLHGMLPKVAHNWPAGAIGFFKKGTWYNAQQCEPRFLEFNGGEVLTQVPGVAAVEGTFYASYQFFTDAPNKNAILGGINI